MQRDPISHRKGGKHWKGHLKRSDYPQLQLAIQKKLNRSFSHQNPDTSLNMSFAGGLNDTVVHLMTEHGRELYDLEQLWTHGFTQEDLEAEEGDSR